MRFFPLVLVLSWCEALAPQEQHVRMSRRGVVAVATSALLGTGGAQAEVEVATTSKRGVVLKNGLKYFDIEEGTGASPSWGQLVTIAFTESVRKNPVSDPLKLFATDEYLIHHGNGRTIKGLDEGLHTMKVGGRRRIEVPAELGYVIGGLGPLPQWAPVVRKFNNALNSIEAGGAIVFDVTLLATKTDSADLGFYDDNSFAGEQLAEIVEKEQQVAAFLKNQAALAKAADKQAGGI